VIPKFLTLSVLLFVAFAVGCTQSTSKSVSRERPAKRLASGEIRLRPEAEQRLDIQANLAPVVSRVRSRSLELRGLVEVAPGGRARLIAPVPGRLVASPSGARSLQPGDFVRGGQPVAWIEPWIDPTQELQLAAASADAQAGLARAQGEAEVARAAWQRAQELLAKRAVAVKVYDDARVRRVTSEADLAVAEARVAAVSSAALQTRALLPLSFASDGVLSELLAVPGEFVASGSPIAAMIQRTPLWIRVPTSLVELPALEAVREARVCSLGDRDGPRLKALRLVRPPPTGVRESVDLYFEVAKPNNLTPGQAVSVQLDLGTVSERVIPYQSVLLGAEGENSVFVSLGNGAYALRRVEIERVVDDFAVLRGSSPPLGTKVVTAGAAELLGVEQGQK